MAGQGGSGHPWRKPAVGLLIWRRTRDPPSSWSAADWCRGILDPLQQAGADVQPPFPVWAIEGELQVVIVCSRPRLPPNKAMPWHRLAIAGQDDGNRGRPQPIGEGTRSAVGGAGGGFDHAGFAPGARRAGELIHPAMSADRSFGTAMPSPGR